MNWILSPATVFAASPVVPVMVIDKVEDAVPMAKALAAGGITVFEITLRTAAALDAIRAIRAAMPEALVGAGTILNPEQYDQAVAAGAQFIISPGFTDKLLAHAAANAVPLIPGVSTPSEIMTALDMGYTHLKFFPAEPAGGLKYIRAIAAPYTMMKFMPTGGINPQNVREYLAYDRIAACGGSWMVKNTMIENNEFDRIEELVKEAVEIVKESRT